MLSAHAPLISAGLLLVLVMLALAGMVGPGRDASRDIAALATTARQQARVIEHQERLLTDQVRLTRSLLSAQGNLLRAVRSGARTGAQMHQQMRELLTLAQRMLAELRDLNRKTGG